MSFSQKIYYNDIPLILTTDVNNYLNDHPESEDYIYFKGGTAENFDKASRKLEKPGTEGAIIEDPSEETLTKALHSVFHVIDAGGGVVYNENNEVLMIFRRGKWDLPKGKADEGENIDECALREVSEETGLENLVLGNKITDTYHTYSQKNDNILKHTAWYKMKGMSTDTLQPQQEEDIMEARWVAPGDLSPLLEQSYQAVRDVFSLIS